MNLIKEMFLKIITCFNIIENLKSKRIRHKYELENKKKFLKMMIGGNDDKCVDKNYLNFYSSFK